MNEIGQAFVRIRPNTLGFKQETEAGVKSGLSGISKIVGSALAVGTAAEIAKSLVKTAQDHEKAFAIVRSTIKATDSAWVVHGQTVQEVLRKQAVALGFNDEELARSFTRIQLGTQDTAKSLKILSEAENLSRASNKELGVTALALVRAYQGAAQSLRRFGIIIAPITDAQDKLSAAHEQAIKSGAKFSAAQNLTFKGLLEQAKALDKAATTTNVLAQVQRRAGDAAAVYAKTSSGQFAILGENIHLLKEGVGKGLLPALNDAASGVSHLISSARESETIADDLHSVGNAVRTTFHGIGEGLKDVAPIFQAIASGAQAVVRTTGGGGLLTLIVAWKSLAFASSAYQAAQLRANQVIAAGSGAAAREAAATKGTTAAVSEHTAAVNTNTASVVRNNAALESGASIQGAEAARLARIAAAERSAAGFRSVGAQGAAISPFLFGGGSRLIRNSANENLTTTAALTRAIKQQEAAIKLDAEASAILAGKLAVTSHVMRDGGLAIADTSGKIMFSSREFGEAEKSLEGFGGTVSSVGAKMASFGRGLLSIGASLAPQLAIAGLAFGIYKLVTAETAWDRANKQVGRSLDSLANSAQRLRNAQNDLKAAEEALPTDRLAVSEARLALARARTALLTSNAAKTSDTYKQLQLDVLFALNRVHTAQQNVTQDTKAAAKAQGDIGIFTRRSAGEARESVKAFANLAKVARADVQARRVPQLPGEAAALAAGKFADAALERSKHAKSVIERRNDEIIAAYARQLKSIPPPKTIELILSNKNAKATLASLLAEINARIPSGLGIGFPLAVPAHSRGTVVGGTGSSDTVPAMLTPGEVVLNRGQQRTLLGRMGLSGGPHALFGLARGFADGGVLERPESVTRLLTAAGGPLSPFHFLGGGEVPSPGARAGGGSGSAGGLLSWLFGRRGLGGAASELAAPFTRLGGDLLFGPGSPFQRPGYDIFGKHGRLNALEALSSIFPVGGGRGSLADRLQGARPSVIEERMNLRSRPLIRAGQKKLFQTQAMEDAVDFYTGGEGHDFMNQLARADPKYAKEVLDEIFEYSDFWNVGEGGPEDVVRHTANLQRELGKARLPVNRLFFRGVGSVEAALVGNSYLTKEQQIAFKRLGHHYYGSQVTLAQTESLAAAIAAEQVGKIFTPEDFTSASLSPSVAAEFGNIQMVFRAHKGDEAAYISYSRKLNKHGTDFQGVNEREVIFNRDQPFKLVGTEALQYPALVRGGTKKSFKDLKKDPRTTVLTPEELDALKAEFHGYTPFNFGGKVYKTPSGYIYSGLHNEALWRRGKSPATLRLLFETVPRPAGKSSAQKAAAFERTALGSLKQITRVGDLKRGQFFREPKSGEIFEVVDPNGEFNESTVGAIPAGSFFHDSGLNDNNEFFDSNFKIKGAYKGPLAKKSKRLTDDQFEREALAGNPKLFGMAPKGQIFAGTLPEGSFFKHFGDIYKVDSRFPELGMIKARKLGGKEYNTDFQYHELVKPFKSIVSGVTVGKGHAGGGIIGGVGSGDTVPAMLTPGEMVLNRRQQRALFGAGGVANPNRLFSMIDSQHFATGGIAGGGDASGTSPVFFPGVGGGLGALERAAVLAFSGAAAAVGAAVGAAARKAATRAAEVVAAAPAVDEADRKIAAHHKLIADLTAQIRSEAKTLPRVAGQDLSEAIALGIVSKNGVVINAVTSQMTDAVKSGIKAVNDSIVSAKQNLNAIGGSLSNDITTLLGKTGGTSEPSGPLAAQFHKLMARIRAGDASSETARAAQTLANELAAAQTVRSARTGGTQAERITRHIADLTDELNKGAISMTVFRKRVEGTLGSAGVTPGKAQKTLGVAFADQLRADIAGVFEQAKAILATPGHSFGGSALAPTIVRPLEQIKIEQRNVAEAAKSQRQQMIEQQKSALSTAKSQLKELQKIRASLKAGSANSDAEKWIRWAARHPRAAAEALAGANNNYTRP